MDANILICGDTIVTDETMQYFQNNRMNELISEDIFKLFSNGSYDFIVANLECPLTNETKVISKCGPALKGSPSCVAGIKQLNIDLVTLGNNHIFDYGVLGLNETVSCLENNGIQYIGICNSKDYNKNYYIKTINGIKVAFYSVCENEFSSYEGERLGANGLEFPRVFSEIKNIKNESDFLIVLFHGGKELYRYPTPFEQKICKAFVDCGADFVVAQHSHCVGCEETYSKKNIIYGQGNFLFGKSNKEEYRTSILISIRINKNMEVSLDYIPIETDGNRIKKSFNKSIINDFLIRSSDKFLINYQKIVASNKYNIFYALLNKSIWYQRIDKHVFKHSLIKQSIRRNKKYLLQLYDFFNCETHRELVMNVLRDYKDE